MQQRAQTLQSTAERYRLMAGTITDPDIARRLLDYADELGRKARHLSSDKMERDGGVDGDA